MLAEAGVYLSLRHRRVGLGDLKGQYEAWVRGIQQSRKPKATPDKVAITTKAGQPAVGPAPDDPGRPAYDAVQFALADPLTKNADQLDLAPIRNRRGGEYVVDGFSYAGPVLEGDAGPGAVALIKGFAGMDPEERRKPQVGSFKVAMAASRRSLRRSRRARARGSSFACWSTPASGTLSTGRPRDAAAAGAGDQGLDRREAGPGAGGGPKAGGLTSLLYAILRAHDAFLTHIHTVERDPDQDLEGITQNKLAAAATAEDERKQVDWVISQEPDVVLLNKIESPGTAADLIGFAAKGHKGYVALRAGGVADAIEQWRKLVGDDRAALSELTLVIAGRVLRKLCMACKVPYAPEPAKLRQLGMNPEKVDTLYQAREEPLRDPKGNPIPCTFCHDLRFKDRTGVYEVLVVDEEVREALARDFAAGGKVGSQFKAVFRKKRGRYLQEEALALVEAGDTSVQEVLRALRSDDPKPASQRAATARRS
jgi:type II secretory ATPase GspE/PulE/Tfp pilus assembly ATPase PilB-like protein